HRAGIVFVLNSRSEVFLTKRSLQKKIFPGCVDVACTFHVKYGQSYEEAAKAELLEETGIKNAELDYLGKFVLDKDPDHLMVAVFRTVSDEKITLDPSEAEEGKYYSIDAADEIIRTQKTTGWAKPAWEVFKRSV
ncbi:MAG: NUDIX domain-containing protein, partial [archaeon]